MTEIKKINSWSLAKIHAGFCFILGFLGSFLMAMLIMANIIVEENFDGSIATVIFFHIGSGILVGLITGVIAGVIGLVAGFIIGGLYNFFAKQIGGLKIDLVEKEKENK